MTCTSSALKCPFLPGTDVMPTKSVGLIWLKLRFSTVAKRVVRPTAAVKSAPASVLIVIDLAPRDWIVPRTKLVFGAAGGASAAIATDDDKTNNVAARMRM